MIIVNPNEFPFDIEKFCEKNNHFKYENSSDNNEVNIIQFNSSEEVDEFISYFDTISLGASVINQLKTGYSNLRISKNSRSDSYSTNVGDKRGTAYRNCNTYDYALISSFFPPLKQFNYLELML